MALPPQPATIFSMPIPTPKHSPNNQKRTDRTSRNRFRQFLLPLNLRPLTNRSAYYRGLCGHSTGPNKEHENDTNIPTLHDSNKPSQHSLETHIIHLPG